MLVEVELIGLAEIGFVRARRKCVAVFIYAKLEAIFVWIRD